jgi:hypothetical protein
MDLIEFGPFMGFMLALEDKAEERFGPPLGLLEGSISQGNRSGFSYY